ncbi:MAG: hypothetical protein JO033_15095 [Acidobacteriaceae bacterium]|nr:hypothetical protein [Acidobacteriaceae bacterium]
MTKLLLSVTIAIALTAGASSATVLTTVPGPSCVGENTPSCPGTIEIFSGDPGTFLAGAVAQMSEVGGPLNVPLAGT